MKLTSGSSSTKHSPTIFHFTIIRSRSDPAHHNIVRTMNWFSALLATTTLVWGSCSLHLLARVEAAPPVQAPVPACRHPQEQQQHHQLFGISQRLPSLLSIRGGAVVEPETLDEVKSLLVRAGGEQKLVVIDFTGRVLFTRLVLHVCLLTVSPAVYQTVDL